MSDDKLTDDDVRGLLRDSLDQAMLFADQLPLTGPVMAASSHIQQAISAMKKEMYHEGNH